VYPGPVPGISGTLPLALRLAGSPVPGHVHPPGGPAPGPAV